MHYFEVECPSCKEMHEISENGKRYEEFKEGKKTRFHCEDCNHKIRMEAMKQVFKEK